MQKKITKRKSVISEISAVRAWSVYAFLRNTSVYVCGPRGASRMPTDELAV